LELLRNPHCRYEKLCDKIMATTAASTPCMALTMVMVVLTSRVRWLGSGPFSADTVSAWSVNITTKTRAANNAVAKSTFTS
jgi:hypothetical protein